MTIAKFAATAVLSAAALGVTAATAQGQGAVGDPGVAGQQQGTSYTVGWAPDGSQVHATLTSGHFALAPDGQSLTVTGPNGAVISQVPLVYQGPSGDVRITPQLDASGTNVTIDRPANAPQGQPIAAAQPIADPNVILANAGIGCLIGAVIGFFFLIVGLIPGCIIGAVAGALYGSTLPD